MAGTLSSEEGSLQERRAPFYSSSTRRSCPAYQRRAGLMGRKGAPPMIKMGESWSSAAIEVAFSEVK